jgi:hypothetical protein
MPRLIPDLGPPELALVKSAAERRFYEAARAQLPDDWTVLFSTPWVGSTVTGRRYDGEADFVILVPGRGMLVVEVKGGGVTYNPVPGTWHSVDRKGIKHEIKDPFRQATAEKHQLIQILQSDARWQQRHPGRLLAGHAVFLADVDGSGDAMGPGGPVAIVGGRGHLSHLRMWVEQVLDFWAGHDTGWSALSLESVKTAEQVLHGRIDARPLMAAQLAEEEAVRIQLTQQQSRVLRGIGARRRAAIAGGAGTGKTLLALERARQLAETAGETLLLCYNNLLADYLKTACAGVPRLHIMTYHELCHWRVREAKRLTGKDHLAEARQRYPGASKADMFDVVLPYALAMSCTSTELRYEAIVIDEGQDFRDEYWLPIEWLLKDDTSSYLYVFLDHNQSFYKSAKQMPITDEPFVLTVNCRNTRHIHETAYLYFRGESTDGPEGNDGVPIAVLDAPSVESQSKAIHSAVVNLITKEGVDPNQIAVTVCGEPQERYIESLVRTTLPHGARWVVKGAAADRGVRLETVRRFKGLEADVVFLWGVDALPTSDRREILYVGISRAKSRLTLVGTREACRDLLAEFGAAPISV